MGNYVATGNPPFINEKLSIAEWNEYVSNYDFGSIPPSRVVLHHTWRPTVAQWKGLTTMKGMQKFYASKGWTAAPHIYAGPDGIWLATPMRDVGIHAGRGNSGVWNGKWSYSIGLEMVGNYDHERPGGAVWENSKAVLGGLSKRLGIGPRNLIYFHRDFSTKSCPGWAVTKEWVWGEVEAWVNNATPPAPPPKGDIGTPTPDVELLIESLLDASYQRGGGYSSELAFHQYAVENGMGVPLAMADRVQVDGKEYTFQPFAGDTLFCEVPKWGEVQKLGDLLGGSIPPAGLGRVLLEASYKACGATFHPDWAFHQYAMSAKIGPPVGESSKISVDGKEYAYQAFAGDTLYNLVPNWGDIQQLSRLSSATDPATVRLRDALLAATYRSGGATYHPDWAFHQIARTLNNGAGIGTPLSKSYQIDVSGTKYAIQVYALDTLYNKVPNWSDVKRLSELARAKGVSFAAPGFAFDVSADARWEPEDRPAHQIIQYEPAATSFSERKGGAVAMVIITEDPGRAEDTLERMTTIGARVSTHYYITLEGSIYQLVDEQYASWHSGMTTLSGVWFNLNRISIGVMIEGLPDDEEKNEEHPESQVDALRWLLRDVVERHNLGPNDVVLSGALATSKEIMPVRLMLEDVFA
jgi:hypothetical protein